MRKPNAFFLASLVALLAAAAVRPGEVAAASPAAPAAFLAPDPLFGELGSLPQPIGFEDLSRAALLASGLEAEGLPPYEKKLRSLVESLRADTAAFSDETAKGEAILAFLHKTVFSRYREDATTLDALLDTGRYNCVSSAVLYLIASKGLGLEVEGVRSSDHAFCSLLVPGKRIDVETTSPYGFDPGNKKEFTDSFGRATGYAYVAPGSYGDRKSIGPRELIGLILSNRASVLERSGRYAEAVRIGADYAALCPGPDSRDFLLDRINNFVADLGSRRRYAEAEDAATAALAAFPGEARMSTLAGTASYNRAASMAQAGDWEGAFDRAAELYAGNPASKDFRALTEASLSGLAQKLARSGDFALARGAVAEREGRAPRGSAQAAYAAIGELELLHAVKDLPFDEALEAAGRIFASGEVSAARYVEALNVIYGNEASRLGSSGDWLAAAALAETGAARTAGAAGDRTGGAARTAGDASLAALAKTLRHNFVVESHNTFARLYNAASYAQAKAAVEAALDRAPGDPTLSRDLAAAEDALRRSTGR
jgi:hypothetical protein